MNGGAGKLDKVSTHSRPKAAGASLKSLALSGFTAPISLSSREKREREYNTALYIAPYHRGIFNITKAPLTKGLFYVHRLLHSKSRTSNIPKIFYCAHLQR